MTAHQTTDEMKQEIEKNAYSFLSKPFDLSQIKAVSETALA